jgi:hypothetical protein
MTRCFLLDLPASAALASATVSLVHGSRKFRFATIPNSEKDLPCFGSLEWFSGSRSFGAASSELAQSLTFHALGTTLNCDSSQKLQWPQVAHSPLTARMLIMLLVFFGGAQLCGRLPRLSWCQSLRCRCCQISALPGQSFLIAEGVAKLAASLRLTCSLIRQPSDCSLCAHNFLGLWSSIRRLILGSHPSPSSQVLFRRRKPLHYLPPYLGPPNREREH